MSLGQPIPRYAKVKNLRLIRVTYTQTNCTKKKYSQMLKGLLERTLWRILRRLKDNQIHHYLCHPSSTRAVKDSWQDLDGSARDSDSISHWEIRTKIVASESSQEESDPTKDITLSTGGEGDSNDGMSTYDTGPKEW